MELHIPTIFVMLIAGCITLAVSALAASERHAGDGLREWGLALCVHATSYILFALRGQIPNFFQLCAQTAFFPFHIPFFSTQSIFFLVFAPGISGFSGARPC